MSNTGLDHTGLRTCHAPLYVNTSDPSTLSLLPSKQPYRTEHYYYILIYLFFSIVQFMYIHTEDALRTFTYYIILLLYYCIIVFVFRRLSTPPFFLYISSLSKTSLLYSLSTLLCLLSSPTLYVPSILSLCFNYSFFHLPHS